MSTTVSVNTYTHSVTYVTDKILKSLKDIIVLSGLSPEKLVTRDWLVLHLGIRTWLGTEHLQHVHLEVYKPGTGNLISRWDFEMYYSFTGDGTFWVDTEAIKYHIYKAGQWPSACDYRVVVTTKPGRPDVEGWSTTTLLSADGFVKQSIGTTIDGSGLSTGTGYWRKAS
jgi:hypothetical protein